MASSRSEDALDHHHSHARGHLLLDVPKPNQRNLASSSSTSTSSSSSINVATTTTSNNVRHPYGSHSASSRTPSGEAIITQRPSTAPSQSLSHSSSFQTPSSAKSTIPPKPSTVPRIALVPETFAQHIKSFKASRVWVRKTPTLNNLSDLHTSHRAKHPSRPSSSSSASASLSRSHPSNLLSPTASSAATEQRSSSTERRPQSSRRPPASFSANGIETAYGPPPALITRNTYHSDLARRAQSPAASALAAQQHKSYNNKRRPGTDRANSEGPSTAKTAPQRQVTDWASLKGQALLSPPPTSGERATSLDAVMYHGHIAGSRGPQSEVSQQSAEFSPGEVHESIESSQSSEDLFLKMAQDSISNLRKEETSQLERKLSRGRKPAPLQRNSLNAQSEATSSARRRNSSPPESLFSSRLSSLPQRTEYRRPSGAASVVGIPTRGTSTLSTEQKFNAFRSRYMSSGQYASSVVSKASDSSYTQRRASTSDHATRLHSYRPSKLNYTSNRALENPTSDDRTQTDSRADGADSAVSTVQSTVWDEMQEAKSHVQRLEQGRRFPYSGGGAGSNGSGERPRTATTTVTTISSSPKIPMKAGMPSPESKIGGSGAGDIHPLLHTSLARCKPVLNTKLYRALENAAADALEMAVWARNNGQGPVYSGASTASGFSGDRQLRKKADNLCRNITDLCIALVEGEQEPNSQVAQQFANQRRESREVTPSMVESPQQILSKPYSRQASVEPEEFRPTPSRALDRVEARRTSLMSNTPPASSPREANHAPAVNRNSHPLGTKPSSQTSGLLRSGTSLLRTRRAATEELEDDQQSYRAPSRATTEIGPSLRKRSDRLSSALSRVADREYTSQHPLPSTNTNVLRRVTGGNLSADASPITPSLLRGTARRIFDRDRSERPNSLQVPTEGGGDDDKKPKRRSLGLYTGQSTSTTPGRSFGLGRTPSVSQKRTSLTTGSGE